MSYTRKSQGILAQNGAAAPATSDRLGGRQRNHAREVQNLEKRQRMVFDMALLEQWKDIAYNQETNKGELQKFWQRYFLLEKGVYEQLLEEPDQAVEGTVKELAEKYSLSIMDMTGFLDGINDSLVTPNPIEEMEEWLWR